MSSISIGIRPLNLSSSLVTLSLAGTGLRGSLTDDILCLPNLQHLHLSFNDYLQGQLLSKPVDNTNGPILKELPTHNPGSKFQLTHWQHLFLNLQCKFNGVSLLASQQVNRHYSTMPRELTISSSFGSSNEQTLWHFAKYFFKEQQAKYAESQ